MHPPLIDKNDKNFTQKLPKGDARTAAVSSAAMYRLRTQTYVKKYTRREDVSISSDLVESQAKYSHMHA